MKKLVFAWREYMYMFDTFAEAHKYVTEQRKKYGGAIHILYHNCSGTDNPHVYKDADGYWVTIRRRADYKHNPGW